MHFVQQQLVNHVYSLELHLASNQLVHAMPVLSTAEFSFLFRFDLCDFQNRNTNNNFSYSKNRHCPHAFQTNISVLVMIVMSTLFINFNGLSFYLKRTTCSRNFLLSIGQILLISFTCFLSYLTTVTFAELHYFLLWTIIIQSCSQLLSCYCYYFVLFVFLEILFFAYFERKSSKQIE